MKISYYNIGCKINFAEIAAIQRKLELKGHQTVEFGTDEEAVIINTCTVTNNADSDARKIIRKAMRNNPDAFIGVLGCYAQLKPGEVSSIEGVDAVFGMKEKFDVVDYLDNYSHKKSTEIFVSDLNDLPFHTACSEDNENRTRMVLKIQDGCDYSCTFCTIPKARGASRSMPFEELQQKIVELQYSTKYEVVLSGVNLGEYQSPTGERFTDVVRFIDNSKPKQRFRISSIEPNMLKDEILRIIKHSNIFCPHFHIPLQSGSKEILKKMKRRYNEQYFEELIVKIKDEMPNCCIGIDVISGFPGESDEQFMETYSLLERLPVSYLHAFTYSERSGTPAAAMHEQVPQHKRKARTLSLRRLSEAKKTEFYKSQIGSISNILPETYDNQTGRWAGWTDNYVRVLFEASADIECKPYPIELTEYTESIVIGKLI